MHTLRERPARSQSHCPMDLRRQVLSNRVMDAHAAWVNTGRRMSCTLTCP
jgi:hypothetical protein